MAVDFTEPPVVPVPDSPVFRILGTPLIAGSAATITPKSRMQCALMVALVMQAGQPISAHKLEGALWYHAPASAQSNLRSHVSRLRRDFDRAEPGLSRRVSTIRSGAGTYLLDVKEDESDYDLFLAKARAGHDRLCRGDLGEAIAILQGAVSLWRGPIDEKLPDTNWFESQLSGLENLRMETYQEWYGARLLVGDLQGIVREISWALAQTPFREPLWMLLTAAHLLTGDVGSAYSAVDRCTEIFNSSYGLDTPRIVRDMMDIAPHNDSARVREYLLDNIVNVRPSPSPQASRR